MITRTICHRLPIFRIPSSGSTCHVALPQDANSRNKTTLITSSQNALVGHGIRFERQDSKSPPTFTLLRILHVDWRWASWIAKAWFSRSCFPVSASSVCVCVCVRVPFYGLASPASNEAGLQIMFDLKMHQHLQAPNQAVLCAHSPANKRW